MKNPLLFLALVAVNLAAGCATNKSAHRVALFDGKTLDGWTQKGGQAKYRVEDGQIIGSTVPNTPNSFLCGKDDMTASGFIGLQVHGVGNKATPLEVRFRNLRLEEL